MIILDCMMSFFPPIWNTVSVENGVELLQESILLSFLILLPFFFKKQSAQNRV